MPNCRSCGAPIRWVKTINGKSMPIDNHPDPSGNITISLDGIAMVVSQEVPDVARFTSHFATCPNAKKHRKES